MILPRYARMVFSLIMSGMMSFVISGISSFRALGISMDSVAVWLTGWPLNWAVAFPVVMVVAPLSQRIVAAATRKDQSE